MKLIVFSILLLLRAAKVLCDASAESSLEDLLDDIAVGGTVLSHPVLELVFSLISILCPPVKAIGFTLEDLTGLLGTQEPDLNTLSLLYTTPNGSTYYSISTAATDIVNNPFFDASQELYIFIHGFTSEANSTYYREINADLIAIGKHNVLALDASVLLKWWYLKASTYTYYIGRKLAEVINSMVEMGLDPADVHIIGHSLGAHIAAFTGKSFTNDTCQALGRITGCDPAGPCFAFVKAKYKLKSTDATFVDVIHTNAGVLGIDEDVGDVDYWPNGGSLQPGCTSESCNHGRSVYYFIESINRTEAFPAKQCSSYGKYKLDFCRNHDISYMGYASSSTSSGKYFLDTNSDSPYGKPRLWIPHKN